MIFNDTIGSKYCCKVQCSTLCSGDTFIYPFGDDESDSETTEFSLMGEEERYQIEAEFKRLIDKIRDQQDLLDKRECASKEEATKLKLNQRKETR